jgi:hypothetical protein
MTTPSDTLRTIAALIKALPGYGILSVSLGVDNDATDALASMGGVVDTTLYSAREEHGETDGHAIEAVELTVDGVRFYCQRDARGLIDGEREQLAAKGRTLSMELTLYVREETR